jgi:hypothetical protein
LDAIIFISPETQNVSIGESFIINIICSPVKPVKAFECALMFNASILQAVSVEEGNIFNGFSTFFNSGTINNTQGLITKVYGLIIGTGNVTNPGTIATIHFNATLNTGTTSLCLFNVCVTNETEYLSISTNNANVTVNNIYNNHILSNESPVNNSYNVFTDTSILSVEVKDPEGDPFYWEITTNPFIGSNSGISYTNSSISCNISNLAYLTTYTWIVKCKDLNSNQWTNKTFFFTTKSSVNKLPSGGGGSPFMFFEENNAPSKPLTPEGSVFIEKNVVYQYSSISFDVDDDKIRYMFDWGDGSFSNWSEFLPSNTTVYLNHYWSFPSSFKIRVIAQDEHGVNSSWSDFLEIIVSEINNVEKTVVLKIEVNPDFNISGNTFVFDASKSIVFNAKIVNYTWNFGDGQFGFGVKTVHSYSSSDEFTVVLIATDENGNNYYETVKINTFFGSNENNKETNLDESLEIGYYVIISVIIVVSILFMVIFKEKIEIKLLNYKIKKLKNK